MPDRDAVSVLRGFWTAETSPVTGGDYVLLAEVHGCYAARSHKGAVALVVPVAEFESSPIGRRASGFELSGHPAMHFAYRDNEWTGPAAVLLCLDTDLLDAFAVLAADVASRMQSSAKWNAILAAVEEWQALLAPRGTPSQEVELGLWGELWFIEQSSDVSKTLSAWRGPERDPTDFFVDGKAVEVKTSRHKRQHHVSQTQVEAPVGDCEAWLLSLWVKVDPGAALTVPALVDSILSRAEDRADALRRLGRAGYSPSDRNAFTSGFVLLSEPEWYAPSDVPRVRTVDPGVTRLRYCITLDEARRADEPTASKLWRHFHGRDFGGTEQ